MKKYLIVIERTASGFSAYSPDVDGCIATGASRSEVEQNMREALEFHIEGMERKGLAVPEPRSESAIIELPA